MFYRKPDFTRLLLIAPRCDPPQRPPERSHTEHRTGISPKRVGDATSSCSINVNPDLGLTLRLMTSVIPNWGPSTIFFIATNSRNNGCPIKFVCAMSWVPVFPQFFSFLTSWLFLFCLWQQSNRQSCNLYPPSITTMLSTRRMEKKQLNT